MKVAKATSHQLLSSVFVKQQTWNAAELLLFVRCDRKMTRIHAAEDPASAPLMSHHLCYCSSFPGDHFQAYHAQGSFHHPALKKVAVTVEFDGGNHLPAVELHTWHLHVLLDLLKVSLNLCNLCWFSTKLRIQELCLLYNVQMYLMVFLGWLAVKFLKCISVLISENQGGTPTLITRLICISNQSEESLRSQDKKQKTVLVLKVPNSKGANCWSYFFQNSHRKVCRK